MSDKMTDEAVRAELERINALPAEMWKQINARLVKPNPDPLDVFMSKTLRLLAESQQALGEIKKISGEDFEVRPLDKAMAKSFDIRLNKIFTIASTAWKGK